MERTQVLHKSHIKWRDINGWNYYFLIKFALLWYGYLNFHPLLNLIFLAFLLFPMPSLLMHHIRNWIAIPIGIVLFYHDTWLPGLPSIMSQGASLFSFSPGYLLDLLNRLINWQIVGAAFVLLVSYLFFAQWIRITVFTLFALIWLNIISMNGPAINLFPTKTNEIVNNKSETTAVSAEKSTELNTSLPPTNENLNAYLNQFYEQQKGLTTPFPSTLAADAEPFDVLIIQICSMAWADLKAVHLNDHPLWSHLDVLFEQFNSAASYSGPAAIRLLRASCGQTSHVDLYNPVPKNCFILDNLAKLGFIPELMLDHDGIFGDFLKEIRENGGLQDVPLMSREGIAPDLVAFNGRLISDDALLLNRWLQQSEGPKRNATYFNDVSLHDGNSFIGQSKTAPYQSRAKKLLDQLDDFLGKLEKSGRKTVVVILAEHGANLVGDKLQMPGLRDIPSPSITHIPAGLKIIGMKSKAKGQVKINESSSYLALSELLSRLVDGKIFTTENNSLETLTQNLPKTPEVSTNEGATVMKYQDKFYILLSGDSNWVPYP